MESPLELIKSLVSNNNQSTLEEYLQICSANKLFCQIDETKREDIVRYINNLINSGDSRNEGFLILEHFLDQCSKSLIQANIAFWLQKIYSESFRSLGKLIQISGEFPEVIKNISKTLIPKVLDHIRICRNRNKEDDLGMLESIEKLLNVYGKSCSLHKEALSAIILSHFESSVACVYTAGKCYLNLAAAGNPGKGGENYADAWFNQQKCILNYLNYNLDQMFENVNVGQVTNWKKHKVKGVKFSIPKIIETNKLKKYFRLAKQFESIVIFLKVLLLGKFLTRKKILPESILSAVWRGLSVNRHTLSSGPQSFDTSCLAAIISRINIASLELLETFILIGRLKCIQFSGKICETLVSMLRCTTIKNWPCGVGKPDSSLRAKVWSTLNSWLTVSRCNSGVGPHINIILKNIFMDIRIDTADTFSSKLEENTNLKKICTDSSPEFILDSKSNADLCTSALSCLTLLLIASDALANVEHHMAIQRIILNILINVQNSGETKPVPYSDVKCRLSLYRVLISICQAPNRNFSIGYGYAAHIFSEGTKDSSLEVSGECVLAMRQIETILHPVRPPLNFSLSRKELEDENECTNKQLEFLLNDSRFSIRTSKRKREQVMTSTPLNGNKVRRVDSDLSNNEFANDSLVVKENSLVNTIEVYEVAPYTSDKEESETNVSELSHSYLKDDEIVREKQLELNTENIHDRNDEVNIVVQQVEENISIVNNSVTDDDCNKSSGNSDDEMLKSFVDEVV